MAKITKKKKNYFPRFFLTLLGLMALLIAIQSTASFLQEKEAFERVSKANIELEGIRLAEEIENQSKLSAEKCLKNQELLALAGQLNNNSNVKKIYDFGLKTREVSDNQPIADGFFLLMDGKLVFPQLKAGKTYSPLDLINRDSSSEEKDFAALFRKAENESERLQYDSAIENLEECSRMPVSDELKSRGLDLLARVYRAAKNPTNAVRIWNRLEDQFPDYLNEYHVPYVLAAAIEIDELEAGGNTDRKETLIDLYKDLLVGRWLLSEEDVLNLKERLEKRLGYDTPEIESSSYLEQFEKARLVERTLRDSDAVDDSEDIKIHVIQQETGGIQLYYSEIGDRSSKRILAISVNQKWFQESLLNACLNSLNPHLKAVSDFTIQPATAPGNPDLSIPFSESFPFLELRLPEGAIAGSQFTFKLQLAVIGLTAVVTLVLLGIIALLILRITKERIAIQMRSDFLSHVSHELKTPLTLIQLYVETLLTDENLPEEDRHYSLEVISKESTNLLNLIENLLQLSGTEKSPEQYKMSEGDLGALIEKTTNVCTEWLNKRGLTLQTRIASGIPYLNFDSEKVTRAFLNLIDNAMKYSGDSGSIDVRLWSEHDKAVLEVQDHGPGIPESEQKKIFDQFYRGSSASDSRGVGLGLYLVSQTMKAHDGSVELHTEAGKGSTFRLIFPIHKTRASGSRI
jgi:signal transduction histidine kinase